MNCQKCGNALVPGDAFCRVCGAAVPNNTMPAQDQNVAAPVPNAGAMNFVQSAPAAPVEQPASAQPAVNPAQPQPVAATPINTPSASPMPEPVAPTPAPAPVAPAPAPAVEPVAPVPNTIEQPVMSSPNESLPVEEEGQKKKSPLLIILLIVVLLGVVAFDVIFFIKPFDKKDNGTAEPTETTEPTTPEFSSWMNYLLGQNITDVVLERTTEDGSGDKTATLTTDQLSAIFTKLLGYQLSQQYLEGSGFTYGDVLTINYTVNEESYSVKIANGSLFADDVSLKDDGLRAALEESEHIVENEDLKDKEGAFYNYKFQNYDSTILDEYLTE